MRKKLIALSVTLLTIGGSLTILPEASAANTFTIVTDSAEAAADLLSGNPTSGIEITNATQRIFGSVHSFSSIDLGYQYRLNSPGILLNSDHNLSRADSSMGSEGIRALMSSFLVGYTAAPLVKSVSSVDFDFTVTSTDIKSVQMDFLFASEESIATDFDIAVVVVDGINYAYLPGGILLHIESQTPLRNLSSNNLTLLTGLGRIESGLPSSTITALLDQNLTTHHITIAVGDTYDTEIATYLAISNLVGSTSLEAGIPEVGSDITLPPDFLTPKTYGNPASVTGYAPALPATPVTPTAPIITAGATSVIYNGVPQSAPYSVDQKSSCSTTYNGSAISPVAAGTYAVSITCSANSLTSTATTTLTITKASPVISWSTPSAITSTTKLGASQLNAFSYIPGSFTYSASAGSSLPQGDILVTATFTPTDTTNYTSATETVTMHVTP